MRIIIFAASAAMMGFFAFVAWQYNVIGGRVFTSGADELHLWALTFLGLTILLCVLVVGITVADAWHKKGALIVFAAVLTGASVVGATAGRLVETKTQDGHTDAARTEAAALLRQADQIERNAETMRESLAVAGVQSSSGIRAAAQEKMALLQKDAEKAADLRARAADLMGGAAVSSSDVLGSFTTPFIVLLALCIELGACFFAHVCAGLFRGEIANAFNGLRARGDAGGGGGGGARSDAASVPHVTNSLPQGTAREHVAPPAGLKVVRSVDGAVLKALRDIDAAVTAGRLVASADGKLKRQDVRNLFGSAAAVDKACNRYNNGERPAVTVSGLSEQTYTGESFARASA